LEENFFAATTVGVELGNSWMEVVVEE